MRGRLNEQELRRATKEALKEMLYAELAKLPRTESDAEIMLSGYGSCREFDAVLYNLRLLMNVYFSKNYASNYPEKDSGSSTATPNGVERSG